MRYSIAMLLLSCLLRIATALTWFSWKIYSRLFALVGWCRRQRYSVRLSRAKKNVSSQDYVVIQSSGYGSTVTKPDARPENV